MRDVFPSIQGTSSYLQHPSFVELTLPGGICPWPLPWRKIGVRLQGSMPAPLFGGYLGCSAWFFLNFSAAKISELRGGVPCIATLFQKAGYRLACHPEIAWCRPLVGVYSSQGYFLGQTPEASPAIGAVVSPATAQVPDPTHLSLAPQEVGLWSCWWKKSNIWCSIHWDLSNPVVFDGIFTINSLRIVLKSVGYFLSDLRLLHTFVAGGVPFIQQGSMGGWRQDYWLPKSNHQQNREQLSSIWLKKLPQSWCGGL